MADKNIPTNRSRAIAAEVNSYRLGYSGQKRQIDRRPVFDTANVQDPGILIDLLQFEINDLGGT